VPVQSRPGHCSVFELHGLFVVEMHLLLALGLARAARWNEGPCWETDPKIGGQGWSAARVGDDIAFHDVRVAVGGIRNSERETDAAVRRSAPACVWPDVEAQERRREGCVQDLGRGSAIAGHEHEKRKQHPGLRHRSHRPKCAVVRASSPYTPARWMILGEITG
jgi:hypothetical protein